MKKCFLLILAFSTLWARPATSQSQSQPVAITHVTVIDATGAPAQPNMTVVITGDRITQIGKKVSVPKHAQLLDATGKFLIPGLWDMHIHIHRTDEPLLLIANGVTGVRLMGGVPEYYKMRRQVESGKALGPRMVIASRLLDGPDPRKLPPPAPGDTAGEAEEWQGMVDGGLPRARIVSNQADAKQAVAMSREEGADFIKIHDELSREAYFALVEESKKQGFVFVGHVPTGVSAAEASDAGQKSIEHLQGILTGCTTDESELRAATEEALLKPPEQRAQGMLAVQRRTVETFRADDCASLAARLVQNQTWQCPTLVSRLGIRELSSRSDELLKYVPVALRVRWQRQLASYRDPPSEEQEVSKMLDQKLAEAIGIMRRAGVKFLAGTDVGPAYKFAGFTLHDELTELNKAGFTPMETIQSATRNAAVFLGKDEDLGTIEKGKLADLVLLDANPLEQISNTRKIDAVMVKGRLLDRKALDDLLAQVAAANAK